jgi:death-on-curing protein
MRKEPLFLTAAEVLSFHSYQIQRFGGEEGIRDAGLLESALAQPCVSYDGNWLHKDLYEMASAYAFHICKNHPFLDGNKRTAFVSALVFLKLNGIFVSDPKEKLPEAIENIAKNILSKASFAELLRELTISS